MKEEKIITYGSGITTKPSDFLCKDGELAECINLTSDMEELKVMAQPSAKMLDISHTLNMASGEKLLFVHDHPDGKCYILQSGTSLYYRTTSNSNTQLSGITVSVTNVALHITAVGRTLIVTDDNGLHYWLWNGTQYDYLGQKIPEPTVSFRIVGYKRSPSSGAITSESESAEYTDILDYSDENKQVAIKSGQLKEAKDLILGLYYATKKKGQRNKGFCEPFFARYALELYDGSYTYISNPVLMYPSVGNNCYFSIGPDNIAIYTVICNLWYNKNGGDYSKWGDIVKKLVIFVSRPISIYEEELNFPYDPWPAESPISVSSAFTDGFYDENGNGASSSDYTYVPHNTVQGSHFGYWNALKQRTDDSKLGDLRSSSVFYKLCELGLEDTGTNTYVNTSKHIGEYVLENIETQQQLKVDDYFSRCPLTPGYTYSYNQRLHLSGVERGFFAGFTQFSCAENSSTSSTTIYVYIKTPQGTKQVQVSASGSYEKFGAYFYYPDPRAVAVTIGSSTYKLEEHPGLNGAYAMGGYPTSGSSGGGTISAPESGTAPTPTTDFTKEKLDNRVLVSEVSNPFVFPAAGDVTVGSGKVIAMATQTVALSQGQFGQFPLLVFCSDGIWALTVGDDGTYLSAKPKSRDVLLYEQGLIETDGAVYFISKKGLMVIGEQVMLMSAHMDGKLYLTSNITELQAAAFVQDSTPDAAVNEKHDWGTIVTTCASGTSFLAFVRSDSCRMAYDYIGSRLLLINPSYNYVFVFNMKDGSISKQVLTAGPVKYAVRDYPDYLIHGDALTGQTATVLSLYGQSDEASDSTRQRAFLLTRPMKLGGGVTVKSLRELQHVGSWETRTTDGTNTIIPAKVKTEIWVSDDGNTWYKDNSRFGAAAKMYRLALYLHLLPSERISGTVIRTQERRDGNLR